MSSVKTFGLLCLVLLAGLACNLSQSPSPTTPTPGFGAAVSNTPASSPSPTGPAATATTLPLSASRTPEPTPIRYSPSGSPFPPANLPPTGTPVPNPAANLPPATYTPLPPQFAGANGYTLILKEASQGLAAQSQVRLAGDPLREGDTWVYPVMPRGDTRIYNVPEGLLSTAAEGFPFGPTPTMIFAAQFNAQAPIITTGPVGEIPAGSLVTVTSGYFDGYQWFYTVVDEAGRYGEATDAQLAPAP